MCVFAAVCACASAHLPQYMCGCRKTSRGQSSNPVIFPVWDRFNWPSRFHRFPSCCRNTWLTDAHNWVQLSVSSRVLNSGPHTCAVNTLPTAVPQQPPQSIWCELSVSLWTNNSGAYNLLLVKKKKIEKEKAILHSVLMALYTQIKNINVLAIKIIMKHYLKLFIRTS